MGFLDKAKDAIQGKEKQIDDAIDKAADVIDDKTGGKHSDKIDQAADKAKDLVEKLDTSDEK
ncbi:MAG: antitoxin [Acidimicrobiales bacterium]|nr:antitoxin [Acidimicrobiales bacterium]